MIKTTPLHLIFSGLIVFAILLHSCQQLSFFSKDNDFSISDTAKVTRFEIISEDTIILTRNGSSWLVNNESLASSVAVNNFLFSFQRMSVKGASNSLSIENEKAVHINIFEGSRKQLIRFYNISGAAFMHKEGSRKYYAVEVNGFPDIKPAEVINPDIDHWKDRLLLNLQAGEIKVVSVYHPSNPENDFQLKISDGDPSVFDGAGTQIPNSLVDREKIDFYLSYFTNVFYDYTEEIEQEGEEQQEGEQQEEEGVRWILQVEDISGKVFELKVYPLFNNGEPDMFLGRVKYNGQPGYKVTRFMVLDLLLQDKGNFLKD
jgi:hypothetical protein